MLEYCGKKGAQLINTVLRLYMIHLFAILAVWLATYYPGLDVVLAVLYLLVVVREVRYHQSKSRWRIFVVVLTWQLTGLFFSLIILARCTMLELYNYAIFVLELWYTPILPFLSMLPTGSLEKPLYYYALLGMPLLYVAVLPLFNKKIKIRRLSDPGNDM